MEWPVVAPSSGTEVVFLEGLSGVMVWANVAGILFFLVLLATAITVACARRRFWCAQAEQEVEVEFEEAGWPGHRRPVAVLTCSRFSPASQVTCDRQCLRPQLSRPC